jgi:hypothetical protein
MDGSDSDGVGLSGWVGQRRIESRRVVSTAWAGKPRGVGQGETRDGRGGEVGERGAGERRVVGVGGAGGWRAEKGSRWAWGVAEGRG